MIERNYYSKFKNLSDEPLLKYFSHLDLQDWTDFFDDYYNRNFTFLLRMLDTPKGEDIYSYGLIWVNDVDSSTRDLIARANDSLLSNYIKENKSKLLEELFKAVRYLKLDVNKDLLILIISNKKGKQNLRELAALTLISVYENSASSFWENLDLQSDQFLIPSYIAFHRKNNPIKGLEKLSIVKDKPENLAPFETPILYSLLQISTSISSTEKYKELHKTFPSWMKLFIKALFKDYPELLTLKDKIQKPYEDILSRIGLDYSVLENESLPRELKHSLNLLLKKIKEKPEIIEKINQDEVSVIDPSYIKTLDSPINKLKVLLKSLNIGKFNDPNDEKVFEATEKRGYYRIPTVFLYPYFLDENRVGDNLAGVIPYAVQNSMAIVIHKENEMYYKWEAIRDSIRYDFKITDKRGIDRTVGESDSTEWLKSFIQHIYDKNGKVNSIRGYVFDAILEQFADKHITDNNKISEVLQLSTDVESLAELPFYRSSGAKETLNVNQILLLDPSDAYKVSRNGETSFQNLNSNYDIIGIKHGLNISVGIGFSLSALPRLLKNSHWKTLQQFILSELNNEHYKNLLMSVGIELLELDSKTINKLNTVKL